MRVILCLAPFLLSGLRVAAEVPSITTPPPSQAVDFGGEVTFTAVAAGTEPLRYEWRHNGTPIAGADTAALTVRNAGSGDSGTYTLTVSNAEGTVTTECYLQAGWADAGTALGFEAGDVLLSAGPELSVLNPESGERRPLFLPEALTGTLGAPARLGHCGFDQWGRYVIFSFNNVITLPATIGVFYPTAGKWVFLSATGFSSAAQARQQEIVVHGDNIYIRLRRFLISGASGSPATGGTLGFSAPSPGEFFASHFSRTGERTICGFPTSFPIGNRPVMAGRLQANGLPSPDAGFGPKGDYLFLAPPGAGAFSPDDREMVVIMGDQVHKLSTVDPLFPTGGAFVGTLPGAGLSVGIPGVTNLSALPQGGYLAGVGVLPTAEGAGRIALLDSSGVYVRDILGGLPQVPYTAVVPPPVTYPLTATLPPADPPGIYTAPEDSLWGLTIPLSYPDPDAVLTLGTVNAPAWVSARIEGRNLVFSGTPAAADVGTVVVDADVSGQQAATNVEFSISVLAVNDKPRALAGDQSAGRDEDAPEETVDLSLLFQDEETPAASLIYRVLSVEPVGILEASVTGTTLRLRYLLNQHGTVQMQVEAADPEGEKATLKFIRTVRPVNDAPVRSVDGVRFDVAEDAADSVVDLTALFSDPETPAANLVFTLGDRTGTADIQPTLTGTTLRFRYAPDSHGSGRLEVSAADPEGLSVMMPFTFTVQPVNDAPVAVASAIQTDEDVALNLPLSGRDVDGDVLTYAITRAPLHGTLTGAAPALVYTPHADYAGPDQLEFTVRDGTVTSASAVVEIMVRPLPDAPRAAQVPPALTAPPAGDLTLPLSPLFTDPDGEPLTFAVSSIGNSAVISSAVVEAGVLRVSFTPYSAGGVSDIVATATDPTGRTAEMRLSVTLAAPALPSVRVVQALRLNRQTGLLELTAEVTNTHTRAISGFTVSFSGMPAGVCLYNGSDCSAESPESLYGWPLQPGESVRLVYQFYSPSRVLNWTPVLTAGISPSAAAAPAAGGLAVDLCQVLPGGGLLIEFAAEPGRQYQIEIMNAGEAWRPAAFTLRAGGTRVQWIDHGPPATPPLPAPGKSRFYRVRKVD